jgi:hypothetical protein
MKVAKANGRLRGKQPKLSPTQEAHLVALYRAGEHTVSTAPLLRRRGLMATATSDGRSTRTIRSDSTSRSSTSFPSARGSQSPCASRSPGTRRSGAAAQTQYNSPRLARLHRVEPAAGLLDGSVSLESVHAAVQRSGIDAALDPDPRTVMAGRAITASRTCWRREPPEDQVASAVIADDWVCPGRAPHSTL